jgi:NADH:ubiquinone oxidoreductase subunit 6 (subunit J)
MLLGESTTGFDVNWIVIAPVVLGFLAVRYLLPAPRRRSLVFGAFGVVAAVLGFGTFLFHGFGESLPLRTEALLMAAFSLQAVTFSVLMIVQRNPARSALFFAVVVLNVCGLFLLLAAPFLMAATIIIYAGAIIVTFLFVIMLSQATGYNSANDRTREPSLAAAVGFMLLGTLLVVLQRVYTIGDIDPLIQTSARIADSDAIDDILKDPDRARAFLDKVTHVRDRLGYGKVGERSKDGTVEIPTHVNGVEMRKANSDPVDELRAALSLSPTIPMPDPGEPPEPDLPDLKKWAAQLHYELSYLKAVRDGRISPVPAGIALSLHGQSRAFEPAPGPTSGLRNHPSDLEPRRLPNANIAALGRTLFTDHLLAIELGGTLLLVATIGAIAIAGGRPEKSA